MREGVTCRLLNRPFTMKREYEQRATPLAASRQPPRRAGRRRSPFSLITNPVSGGSPPAFSNAQPKLRLGEEDQATARARTAK